MTLTPHPLWADIQRHFGINVDTMPTPTTLHHIAQALDTQELWTSVQVAVGARPDGIPGPLTATAIINKLRITRKTPPTIPSKKEILTNRSIYGRAGDESNLVNITPPYQLYYDGTPVKTIRIHKLAADDLLNALQQIKDEYKDTIHLLKLDIYDGTYNNRAVRGGTATSTHAYGIAIDLCAERNGMKHNKDTALFAKPQYARFISIMEANNFRSFGKANGYDYMHFERCTA